MLIKIYLFLITFLFVSAGITQREKAMEITEVLCSDSLFGRGYLKNGVNKAGDYLASKFKKSGLQPYFDDSYFQHFKFDVNTFPGNMDVKLNDKTLTAGKDFVVDASSGGFEGELIFAPTIDTSVLDDPTQIKEAIGKIESSDANAFFIDVRNTSSKKENEMLYGLTFLANKAPVVITTSQKFTWSVGREKMNFPFVILKEEFVEEKMNFELDIEAKFVQNFESKNVAGYLPSGKKRAKTIVFTAHYDHLGGMGTEAYFPGANDNASGTAMLISMADYFRENPVDYNLLFIAFAGEEAGLLGSKHFVEEKSIKMKKIAFLLNLDIMGSGEEGITVVNGSKLKEPFEKLQEINAEKNYLTKVKSRGETQNSDHYYFYKEGVPSFFIYTMGHNKHYHDVFDTHEELSFAAYDNIVKLLIDFVSTF
ncbi:MAG: M28 family peptidase [Brumimicrobium sp.]